MKYSNIRPTMFRALSSFYEDEKEHNDKIIKDGIVPPTELIAGTGEENIPPLYGSSWSLNHEYVVRLYNPLEIHSILKKKIDLECINGKMEITDPEGCKIQDNDLEGVFIVCTRPVKFDSAEVTGNPTVFKGKRRFK